MTFFSGQNGQLYIEGVKAAKVKSWSFNTSLQTLDTTTLEQTDRTITPGIRSTTGQCSLFYYQDGTNNSAKVLIDKLISKATSTDDGKRGIAPETDYVELELRVTGVTATDPTFRKIRGKVLLTSASMSMAVGEVLSADVTFEFDGAPTLFDL